MERYEKTTVWWAWEGTHGLKTDALITDSHHPNKACVHTIHAITATSLPDRWGEILIVFRWDGIQPNVEARNIICDRLESGLVRYHAESRTTRYISLESGRCPSDKFIIRFKLRNGHHFCETVIPIARLILDTFQVHDPERYELSDFEIDRETLFKSETGWITFENWLRIQNHLPVKKT